MTEYAEKKRAEREARLRVRAKRRKYRITIRGLVSLAIVAALGMGAFGFAALIDDVQDRASRRPALARAIAPRTPGPSVAALATEAASVAISASRPTTLTVAAVGDMIFDRRVKSLVQASGGTAPLAEVASHLAAADIAVGNLESPLSSRGTEKTEKDVRFRGDPRGVEGLAASGFDFLSLANNHVLDWGSVALADTISLLKDKGIGYAGAGSDRAAAWTPAVVERGGASVAFLSFSHILPPGFVATKSSAGLAQGRNNMDAVVEAIKEAKAEHDYVLVSFHWGVEYADDCNGDQVRDAHRAIDAGADMVLSHHPHVIQALEFYKGKLIAYSLGDFVFDHYSRKTGEAFILDAELGPHGTGAVRVTPVYLDGNGKPEIVRGAAARTILDRLKLISAKRGTSVTITGDTAVVAP
jgi:poly-gamma-glutamate synthesis protein (capsule biosynthesis protein)